LSAVLTDNDVAVEGRPLTTVTTDRPPSTDPADSPTEIFPFPWAGLPLTGDMGENTWSLPPLPKRLVVSTDLWDMSDSVGDVVEARELGCARSPGLILVNSSSSTKNTGSFTDGGSDGVLATGRFFFFDDDDARGAEKALLAEDRDDGRNRGNTTSAGGSCTASALTTNPGDVDGRLTFGGDGLMNLATAATEDGETMMSGRTGGPPTPGDE